jgi:hypothetical protein
MSQATHISEFPRTLLGAQPATRLMLPATVWQQLLVAMSHINEAAATRIPNPDFATVLEAIHVDRKTASCFACRLADVLAALLNCHTTLQRAKSRKFVCGFGRRTSREHGEDEQSLQSHEQPDMTMRIAE